MLEAGKTYARQDAAADAHRALRVATEHRSVAGPAWLAIARMFLLDDPAAAYEAYSAAATVNPRDKPTVALAKLGMATALERLEGRDAALAQLDQALAQGDLLDRSLERRRQRLRGGM